MKSSRENGVAPAPTKRRAIVIPAFKSEEEEANWWDAHPEAITKLFAEGARKGTITRGMLAREAERRQTHTTTIRLFTDDLARAKAIAHRKGLRYQTYLKMLIHEGVERDHAAG